MKKRFAASAMILCYERSNSTFPAYCICRGRRTGIEHCHFPGWIWGCLLESDGGAFWRKPWGRESKHDYQPTIGDIIRPQIVAGNAPDFICLNDGGEDGVILSLIKDHALLNLDDVFDGENYAGTGALRGWYYRWDPFQYKVCTIRRWWDLSGTIQQWSAGVWIYNKTFFDENNLEVPKTWDESLHLVIR